MDKGLAARFNKETQGAKFANALCVALGKPTINTMINGKVFDTRNLARNNKGNWHYNNRLKDKVEELWKEEEEKSKLFPSKHIPPPDVINMSDEFDMSMFVPPTK